MGADGQVIVVAVDEFEWEHAARRIQHSAGREPKTPYHTRLPEVWENVVRCSRFAARESQFALRPRLLTFHNC